MFLLYTSEPSVRAMTSLPLLSFVPVFRSISPSIEHDFFHSAKNKEVAVVVDPHIARYMSSE